MNKLPHLATTNSIPRTGSLHVQYYNKTEAGDQFSELSNEK